MVDQLVVNDNSGLESGPNRDALEASAFARRGTLRIERHPFVDFADMRNRAFAALAQLPVRPGLGAVLGCRRSPRSGVALRRTRNLAAPPRSVAQLDGYTYHFFGTFGWISDVARRMMFFRYDPGLRWVNPVHEKLTGLSGKTVVIPYVYYHYGNVLPPPMLAAKHLRYYALGNKVPRPPDVEDADSAVYLAKAGELRAFRELTRRPLARPSPRSAPNTPPNSASSRQASARAARREPPSSPPCAPQTRACASSCDTPSIRSFRAGAPAGTARPELEKLASHVGPTALRPSAFYRAGFRLRGPGRSVAPRPATAAFRRRLNRKRPAPFCRSRSVTRRCASASRCSRCTP